MTPIADDIPLLPVPEFPNYFYNEDDPTQVFRRLNDQWKPVIWRQRSITPGNYKQGEYKSKNKSYTHKYVVLTTAWGVRHFTRKSWLKYIAKKPRSKEITV